MEEYLHHLGLVHHTKGWLYEHTGTEFIEGLTSEVSMATILLYTIQYIFYTICTIQ